MDARPGSYDVVENCLGECGKLPYITQGNLMKEWLGGGRVGENTRKQDKEVQ